MRVLLVLCKVSHMGSWSTQQDRELSDKEFVGCLDRAGILKAVAISRNLRGFRDAKGLKHLVRR